MRQTTRISGLLAAAAALLVMSGGHASAQTVTCSSFQSQSEAQTYYDNHKDQTQLDADGDGTACEGLPGGATTTAAPTSTQSIPKNGAETGVMAMSGLSLVEAGYGLTLVARRYGVKRRAIPMYLLRKLVSAGKAGETIVPVGEDIYLVHESVLTATAGDVDVYHTVDLAGDDEVFEAEDDAEFRPATAEAFDEFEDDDEAFEDDPWTATFGWRV